MAMTLQDMGKKVMDFFTFTNLSQSLPALGAITLGVFLLDKFIDVERKIEPLLKANKFLNDTSKLFTTIDNIGDNLQLIVEFLGIWGIEIEKEEIKKIGDFLQNLGTSGKWISKFWEIIGGKIGGTGVSGLLGFSGAPKQY